MTLNPAPTYDCRVCYFNVVDHEGKPVRARNKGEVAPCKMCHKGSPEYVPEAFSVEATDLYLSLSPSDGSDLDWVTLAGALPPKMFEGLRLVGKEVAKWREKKREQAEREATRKAKSRV